jgi:Ca2+-binding RTX toxin-like protein
MYEGGKEKTKQSDFNLHAVTYSPTAETGDAPKTAIVGKAGKDIVDGVQTVAGQPVASDGVDVIAGLKGKDKLSGLGGNDTLDGGAGKDKLYGGDGDDVLIGGAGKNKMTGGAGSDAFVFDAPLAKLKPGKIADFVPGEDRIVLDDAIFRKLDPGVLASKFFVHGKAAKDGNDYIGYDSGKGTVYYDKNGDKPGGYVALATLKKGLDIDAGDFLVV